MKGAKPPDFTVFLTVKKNRKYGKIPGGKLRGIMYREELHELYYLVYSHGSYFNPDLHPVHQPNGNLNCHRQLLLTINCQLSTNDFSVIHHPSSVISSVNYQLSTSLSLSLSSIIHHPSSFLSTINFSLRLQLTVAYGLWRIAYSSATLRPLRMLCVLCDTWKKFAGKG